MISFYKNISYTLLSQLFLSFSGFFLIFYLSREITKDSLGIYLIIKRLIALFVPIISLNLGLSLAKFSYDKNIVSRKYLINSIRILILITMILVLPIVFFRKYIIIFIFSSPSYFLEFISFLIFLFVNILHNYIYNFYRGSRNYFMMNIINYVFAISGILSLIIIINIKHTNLSHVFNFFIYYSIILFFVDLLVLIRLNLISQIFYFKGIKEILINKPFLKYGVNRLPSVLFIALIFTLPVLLTTNLESSASLGIVISIFKMVQIIVFPFNVVILPEVSRLVRNKDYTEINGYFTLVIELIFSFMMFFGISLFFFIPEFIYFWVGKNFESIIYPLKIITPFIGFYLGYILLRGIIDGLYDKPYINVINGISALLLFFLLTAFAGGEFYNIIVFGISVCLLGISSFILILIKENKIVWEKKYLYLIILNTMTFIIFYYISKYVRVYASHEILTIKMIVWFTSLIFFISSHRYINPSFYKWSIKHK